MSPKKSNVLCVVDFGSTRVSVGLAELGAGQYPTLLGLGFAPPQGIRGGAIVDLQAAAASIRQALEEAETTSGQRARHAIASIIARDLLGFNSSGLATIGITPAPITESHVQQGITAAKALPLPPEMAPIHYSVRQCIVDGGTEVDNPCGMQATRVETCLHVMTLRKQQIDAFTQSINRSGLYLDRLVVQPLAAAEAVLHPDERELGTLLVHVGYATTSALIYQKNKLQHCFSIPVGGDHFTRDLVQGLRLTYQEAERLKIENGFAPSTQDSVSLEAVTPSGDRPQKVARPVLAEILKQRAADIQDGLRQGLRTSGFESPFITSAVFSGGGALLQGLLEYLERGLDVPCRLGYSPIPESWPGELSEPIHASLVGLFLKARLAHARRDLPLTERLALGESSVHRTSHRFRRWLDSFLRM